MFNKRVARHTVAANQALRDHQPPFVPRDLCGSRDDVFPQRAAASLGRDRIVADAAEIVAASPDIIVGSWCGKKFRAERVAARPGWDTVAAVVGGELHEIKSPLILQPGPAALTDGLDALHRIVARWAAKQDRAG